MLRTLTQFPLHNFILEVYLYTIVSNKQQVCALFMTVLISTFQASAYLHTVSSFSIGFILWKSQ